MNIRGIAPYILFQVRTNPYYAWLFLILLYIPFLELSSWELFSFGLDNPMLINDLNASISRLAFLSVLYFLVKKEVIINPFPWLYRQPRNVLYLLFFAPVLFMYNDLGASIANLQTLRGFEILVAVARPLLTAVIEELLFRGVLFILLIKAYEKSSLQGLPFKAIVASSLLFGLTHILGIISSSEDITGILLLCYSSFCLGTLFATLFLVTQNLSAVIVCHFLLNLTFRLQSVVENESVTDLEPDGLFQKVFTLVFTILYTSTPLLLSALALTIHKSRKRGDMLSAVEIQQN